MMKCLSCDEKARWIRCTQFAGNHPYCDLHALMEEDFGENDSYSFWDEHDWSEKVEKKLYLVETVSMFRMRYVIEAREEGHALDEVTMNATGSYNENFQEFSQEHLDEVIVSSRKLSAIDYMDLFDKDNDYLKSWSDQEKMKFINTIEYEDEKNSSNR